MKVTLWLNVVPHLPGGNGVLWSRILDTAQAPAATEDLILWSNEEEGAHGGPLWSVYRRYWDADGGIHCELSRVLVDPPEPTHHRGNWMRSWYTATDGDPSVLLEAGGWTRYSPTHNAA